MKRIHGLAAGAIAIAGLAGLTGLASGADDTSGFAPIYQVLMSPRCVNCHPVGDAPHIGDQGNLHRMNVSRRSPEAGMPCSTCHRSQNAPFAHGPPGVPGWQLPPADHPMPFEGKSAHDLCEQLKDTKKNGGKSLVQLHDHFAKDAIVLWGWSPGPGRTVPPIPHAELVKAVDKWIAGGAKCPP
jgi:hypothetical protein